MSQPMQTDHVQLTLSLGEVDQQPIRAKSRSAGSIVPLASDDERIELDAGAIDRMQHELVGRDLDIDEVDHLRATTDHDQA